MICTVGLHTCVGVGIFRHSHMVSDSYSFGAFGQNVHIRQQTLQLTSTGLGRGHFESSQQENERPQNDFVPIKVIQY